MLAKRLISLNLFIFCPHTRGTSLEDGRKKKLYTTIFICDIYKFGTFPIEKKEEKARQLEHAKWLPHLCNMTLHRSEPSWAENIGFPKYNFCTNFQDIKPWPIESIFGIS